MKINDLTWMIGGEAGFGIQSAGHIFALAASRGGLHVFGTAEYPSLIRGGHNSDVIRVSDKEVMVHKERLDLLLAMNKETLDLHLKDVVAGGGVIYDADVVRDYELNDAVFRCRETSSSSKCVSLRSPHVFHVPLKRLAMEFGKGDITRNTVGIGASFGLLEAGAGVTGQAGASGETDADEGSLMEIFYSILREMFTKKGEQIVINNFAAARAGYEYVREHYPNQFGYELRRVDEVETGRAGRLLLTGNDALCLGALKAGCKFVAEYPMTPSSSILHFMAANAKDYNIIVKHTEDEIAAMNMVIGAGFAGVRAMTGTSGGGFSLMVEALGMAGMCEVPVVCVNVQRPGPSTGLPTRTEQGDLQFVLHASQGEFPRIVIAPGDFDECFKLAFDAFNLAEKYQTPVLILSDKHLAESVKNVEPFKTEGLKVDRGKLLSQSELDKLREKSRKFLDSQNGGTLLQRGFGGHAAAENYLSPDNGFLRYKFLDDGVSFRTIPGMVGGVHRASTDEHDESGDLTETEENRSRMVEKRARKLEVCLKELPAPRLVGYDRKAWGENAEPADITFVTWGSPTDAVREVMEMLARDGVRANMLQIVYMSPFHSKEVGEILRGCKRTIGVEMNSEGQLCALIAEKTGYFVNDKILKYSGRQFTADEIYERVKGLLANGL